MDSPPVVIALLTYARTNYALATIAAMLRNWRYANTLWYVADDGSAPEHVATVLAALDSEHVVGWHSERRGYGYSATRAWFAAHEHADVTLFLEDDWELKQEFDPTYYVQTLMQHDDIGMIRLSHLPINLKSETCGYYVGGHGAIYLRMSAGQQYAFSGNPALRHRRAREAWGAYPEGLNPGDTELAYDHQIQQRGGPSILWPVGVGEWGVFGHIGAVPSYEVKKGGE